MQQNQRSRTIEIPAIMRALHQTMDDHPKILEDPIAPRLIATDADRVWLAPLLDHPFAKQWRAGFALRARYAEDALAEAIQRSVRQYVVLGAGLDTFAYRQPGWAASLTIFEVDHPATQLWKQELLKAADVVLPPNLRFVPIDFEQASIQEGLSAAGFASQTRTLCSWMGVTQYLTLEAVDATFRFVLSLPSASEIVFSFILPPKAVWGVEAEALKIAEQRSAAAGEPWLTRIHPSELAAKLHGMGFLESFILRQSKRVIAISAIATTASRRGTASS